MKPGIISGGPVTHDCPLSRSIGYFLEPIIMIAPFAKKPFQLTLRGITTNDSDLSVSRYKFSPGLVSHIFFGKVDLMRTVTLPHVQLFGVSDGLELRVGSYAHAL